MISVLQKKIDKNMSKHSGDIPAPRPADRRRTTSVHSTVFLFFVPSARTPNQSGNINIHIIRRGMFMLPSCSAGCWLASATTTATPERVCALVACLVVCRSVFQPEDEHTIERVGGCCSWRKEVVYLYVCICKHNGRVLPCARATGLLPPPPPPPSSPPPLAPPEQMNLPNL